MFYKTDKEIQASIYSVNGEKIKNAKVINHNGVRQVYSDLSMLPNNKYIVKIKGKNFKDDFRFVKNNDVTKGPVPLNQVINKLKKSEQNPLYSKKNNVVNGRTTNINEVTISYVPDDYREAFGTIHTFEIDTSDPDPNNFVLIFNVVLKKFIFREFRHLGLGIENLLSFTYIIERNGQSTNKEDIIPDTSGPLKPYARPGIQIINPNGSYFSGNFQVNMIDVDPNEMPVGFRPFDKGEFKMSTDIFNEDPPSHTLPMLPRRTYVMNVFYEAKTKNGDDVRAARVTLNGEIKTTNLGELLRYRHVHMMSYDTEIHWLPSKDNQDFSWKLYGQNGTSAGGVFYNIQQPNQVLFKSGDSSFKWDANKQSEEQEQSVILLEVVHLIEGIINPEDYNSEN